MFIELLIEIIMEDSVGPLAMVSYELRQAWKGATVIVKSCAEVWLAGNSTLLSSVNNHLLAYYHKLSAFKSGHLFRLSFDKFIILFDL